MLLFLPLIGFLAWVRLFRLYVPGVRERLLLAAVWWTLCLIVITESLSALGAIRKDTLAIAWLIVATLTFIADVLLRRRHCAMPRAAKWEPLYKLDWSLLVSCIAILALTLITALVAPPNGWDVTLQHLPRAMEWIAQGSVGLFPTNYYVQDFAPPLAEWMMTHLLLLHGSDRFVNLVQWLGSAGSALAVSLIAREFGCALRGQLIAALFCLTIPQGILSASGAKNDWVVALWLCISVFFVLRWQRDPRWLYGVTIGIALGALILTKGTGYAFGPPAIVALLFVTPRGILRNLPAACLTAAAILLLINVPTWSKNYRLAHSIFGLSAPDIEGRLKYTADRITPATVAANVLRETAIHFGTPFDAINRRNTSAVKKLIHVLGVDPDDPQLIRPGPSFAIPAYSLDEYLAGNPLHLLLTGIAFIAVLAGMRRYPREAALAIGIIAGFILYCAVFKWEIWAARLHLGLFVLACPVIAAVLYRSGPKMDLLVGVAVVVLAIPPLLFNSIRPLVSSNEFRALLHRPLDPHSRSIFLRSRDEMYFAESLGLESTYLPAGKAARKLSCAHIDLDTTNYPFAYGYILMGIIDDHGPIRTYRYVGVDNFTARFAGRIDRQPPCAVLCVSCLHDPVRMSQYSATLPSMQPFGTLVLFSR